MVMAPSRPRRGRSLSPGLPSGFLLFRGYLEVARRCYTAALIRGGGTAACESDRKAGGWPFQVSSGYIPPALSNRGKSHISPFFPPKKRGMRICISWVKKKVVL